MRFRCLRKWFSNSRVTPKTIRHKRSGLKLEHLEDRTTPATFTVVNTLDSGAGSLRQAILDANANPGADLIQFNMDVTDANHIYYKDDGLTGQVSAGNITVTSASDDSMISDLDPDHAHSWWRIQPTSILPSINGTATIDGYTQAGSSVNTQLGGLNTVLRIEVNGSLAPDTATTGGLYLNAINATVRGLSVNSFWGPQINVGTLVSVGGEVVEGNFIGVDPSGLRAGTDQGRGVYVFVENNGRIGTNADGLNDLAERNLISGASIGVDLSGGTGFVVAGNLIGTDITGTRAIPNTTWGIEVGHDGFLIGGTSEVARNVVSGNKGFGGIGITDVGNGPGGKVQGNFIGVDVSGTRPLGNSGYGIGRGVTGSTTTQNILIGGTEPGARNIISANGGSGIILSNAGTAAAAATVQGNYIGTDVTGMLDLGNGGNGISIRGPGPQIGGTAPGAGNLISGNGVNGVSVGDALNPAIPTTSTRIEGNRIGTNADGTGFLGNSQNGVLFVGAATSNIVGGTGIGAGNVIAGNSQDGVRVSGGSGNSIRGNSIYSNGGLGIDLDPNGVTPNDPNDPDTGPNHRQNFPLIASAAISGSGTTITGSLNSTPLTTFALDFYASAVGDLSGFGEGQTYLGSFLVSTDITGNVAFTGTVSGVAPVGQHITATATAPDGSTSEFSGNGTIAIASNQPPTAVDDDAETDEDMPVLIDVIGNDEDPDGNIDPGNIIVIGGPSHGTAISNGDGTFTYTPFPDRHGTDEFTYRLPDTDGDYDIGTVTIVIHPVNDQPTAGDDSAETDEDTPVLIDVIGNDEDPDGNIDPGSVIVIGGPSHGTAISNGDGTFTYTPAPNYHGTDEFTYRLPDTDGDYDVGTVTIIVHPVNDAAQGGSDSYTLPGEGVLVVPGPGVLDNDEDIDGDDVTAELIDGPDHGTLVLNPDGSFIYTPDIGFSGPDTFTYRASDGQSVSDPVTVTLNVTAPEGTPGKITGGGSIDERIRNFGFVVQTKVRDGVMEFTGSLEFQDKALGINLHSSSITLIRIEADKVHGMFVGTATINGIAGYNFRVTLEDNAEPGARIDKFRIEIQGPGGFRYDSNDYASMGGLLDRGGNIQIHTHGGNTGASTPVPLGVANVSAGELSVYGTNANDVIEVRAGASSGSIEVIVNGSTVGTHTGVSKLRVFADGGDDIVRVNSNVGALGTVIYGGDGNDRLYGGVGNNVLVGGDGDDMLVGSSGRDILIGGFGQDVLQADQQSDILMGDEYLYAQDLNALDALMATWASSQTYEQRVHDLQTGAGGIGSFALDDSTVVHDAAADSLTGAQQVDWFLVSAGDSTDQKGTEMVS